MNKTPEQSAAVLVRHNFVDESTCSDWLAAVKAGRQTAATIANAKGDSVVDERARRTLSVAVDKGVEDKARHRFSDLLPEIRKHFGVSISIVQEPQFLMYSRGDHFRPHQDSSVLPAHGQELMARRVSIVLFLNERTQLPEQGAYCGGDLVLYMPRIGAAPRIQVHGKPGLLVAFLSTVFHEVRPVTHGERYTVVSWYAQGA
jgi:predicted 2-oxoglutarate/Fe(II)-dependent dioxygenase YbiX